MDLHTRTRTSLTKGELAEIFDRIETLNYKGFRIRTVKHDGQLWIVFADICKALGYRNPAHESKRLDSEEKCKLDIGLKNTLALCINRDGLYTFLLFSGKTEVAEFREWASKKVFDHNLGGI